MLPKAVKVCIVGAGVAGLSAAQYLSQQGFNDYIILEAQDRVGGRIHSVQFDNHVIEYGAQWIHGEKDNIVYKWASNWNEIDSEISLKQTGLGNTIYLHPDGDIVDPDIIEKFHMVVSYMEATGEKELENYSGSLGQYYKERFETENEWSELGNQLLEWFGRFQSLVDGSDTWFDVSAKGQVSYKECDGKSPVMNWYRGHNTLIEHLEKSVPKSKQFLNMPVKLIEWKDTKSSHNKCTVVVNSGEKIMAECIIFTPSLGVLKSCDKLFHPPLPSQKLRAIKGIGFDIVDKIFLKFPDKWWPDDCDGFSFLNSNSYDSSSVTNENWSDKIIGFYEVHKQPAMLCGWITGKAALIMEGISLDALKECCMDLLQSRLQKHYHIPDPVWCGRTSWGTNEWVKGGYSFRSLETELLGVSSIDLAEPVYDSGVPVICFAGEATHNCYYSTVHGAVETGIREARRFLHSSPPVEKPSILNNLDKFQEKYDVIIVGAGMAGIAAALTLKLLEGLSVLILEGNTSPGGRIHSLCGNNGSRSIEFGAQWIHGENNNPLYALAQQFNILSDTSSNDGSGIFYTESGEAIDEALVDEAIVATEEAEESCLSFNSSLELHLPESFGHHLRAEFEKYLLVCNRSEYELKLLEKVYNWSVRWYRIDNGCNSLYDLSAKYFGEYKNCDGETNMNLKCSMLNFLNMLIHLGNLSVTTDSEVTRICLAENLVETPHGLRNTEDFSSPVRVFCQNGKQYDADHVIYTGSLGYLKRHHQELFVPELPTSMQTVISAMGYGTINKIFLKFENPWWPQDFDGIQFAWDDDLPNLYESQMSNDEISAYLHKNWYRGISGFDLVFDHPTMLCGWIGGLEAEYMETLSQDKITNECMKLLSKCYRSRLPPPQHVLVSRWKQEKYSLGAYSYRSTKLDTISVNTDELNQPVMASVKGRGKVPLLILAGEANSKEYYSTLHGAFQSGMKNSYCYLQNRLRFKCQAPTPKL